MMILNDGDNNDDDDSDDDDDNDTDNDDNYGDDECFLCTVPPLPATEDVTLAIVQAQADHLENPFNHCVINNGLHNSLCFTYFFNLFLLKNTTE